MNNYLKKQIITYMGNKRKLLPEISKILDKIIEELGEKALISVDAFSGS